MRSQEFFSDGMTDEISGALAKIPDLRVVGRTSAFQFKKRRTRICAPSARRWVRRISSKARCARRATACASAPSSFRPDNGLQVWSENYDRDLTDVFAIQEDIAKAIAASLRMPLGLKPGENLVNSRTKNEASYEEYLRAKALVRRRNAPVGGRGRQAAGTGRRPRSRFCPRLGASRALRLMDLTRRFLAATPNRRAARRNVSSKAEAAAQRAIQLDPKNADGYVTLGFIQHVRGKQILRAMRSSKAMALDPTNPDGLHLYSDFLADMGYVKKALPLRQQLLALEPFVPVFQGITARIMYGAGNPTQPSRSACAPIPSLPRRERPLWRSRRHSLQNARGRVSLLLD